MNGRDAMPMVAPLVEFNRSQSEVIAEIEKTGEPMYLTRNGRAVAVVMDVAAYERAVSNLEQARALEQDVYTGILRGYRDKLEGRTTPLGEADARIRAAKGW